MNILVIGNGFDIAHGLKTGYDNFVNVINTIATFTKAEMSNYNYKYPYYEDDKKIKEIILKVEIEGFVFSESKEDFELFKELVKINHSNSILNHLMKSKNDDKGWVGVEDEIGRIVEAWVEVLNKIDLLSQSETKKQSLEQLLSISSKFIMESFFEFYNKSGNYNIGQLKVDYFSVNRGTSKQKLFTALRNQLDGLIRSFEIYLILYVKGQVVKPVIDMEKISPDLVVNFNYTDTYREYQIPEDQVKYIHGKIESIPNNIVMGMNVYEEEYDRRFIYFMKFFQRIQHKNDILKAKDLFELADVGDMYGRINQKPQCLQKVYFIGHSMSNADGDVIRLLKSPVMETEDFSIESEFIIYYYDQRDYEHKVINLFEVFGKDETIQMIHDEEIVFLPLENIVFKQATK